MKWLKMTTILCCCGLLLSGSACHGREKQPGDEIVRYSIAAEPDTLDPQIADTNAQMLVTNLFEGLVRCDADGQPAPGVAKSWSISADGTVYTFFLREEACWSNGEPVTAEDFAFGIQRTLDPLTGSDEAFLLYAIQNAEAIHQGKMPLSSLGVYAAEHRLIILLNEPDPHFLLSLTKPAAMPCQKDFFTTSSGRYGREADQLICNGAFCLNGTGWIHGKALYLRRNPFYHGEHTPLSAGINITIGTTIDNACQAIQDGMTDCCALSRNERKQAEKNGLSLVTVGETVWGIAFNTQAEGLQHESIRRALLSSLDRTFILSTLPYGCQATEDIVPDTFRYNDHSYRAAIPDSLCLPYHENAKADWQKAMQQSQLTAPPKLTILCPDDAATQAIVNNIMQTWNDLTGSYINKRPLPADELQQSVLNGNYQVILLPLTAEKDHPEALLSMFSSDSRCQIGRLSDAYYDDLVHTIQSADGQLLSDGMLRAEKYLNDKGIFYPLYTEHRYYVHSPSVKGILFRADDSGPDFFFAEKTPST